MVQRKETGWRKSTYCDSGSCTEVVIEPGVVRMRSSKDPNGPVLSFGPEVWAAFVAAIRDGTV
jgi:hypothetical protein